MAPARSASVNFRRRTPAAASPPRHVDGRHSLHQHLTSHPITPKACVPLNLPSRYPSNCTPPKDPWKRVASRALKDVGRRTFVKLGRPNSCAGVRRCDGLGKSASTVDRYLLELLVPQRGREVSNCYVGENGFGVSREYPSRVPRSVPLAVRASDLLMVRRSPRCVSLRDRARSPASVGSGSGWRARQRNATDPLRLCGRARTTVRWPLRVRGSRMVFAAPFVATEVGTDRYVDEIW